jgi:Cu/Ag efflux protein CusF
MEVRMRAILMIGVLSTALAVACGGGGGSTGGPPAGSPSAAAAPAESPAAAATAKTHDIRGRIEAIGADRRTVTLDHEEIPGVMAAMKMEYQVQDPAVLEGLKAGDRVQGQIEVRPGDQYVVIRLRK